ncbi:MAG: rubrerythrin family protein [Candidatus Bathyarchaeia archaeon]
MRETTEQNLKNAFSGESQAHMRYIIFSEIAESEGFKNTARLFKAISYAEKVHANNHFSNLAHLKGGYMTIGMAGFGPGGSSKNLDIAIEGEMHEINEMYPTYLETAKFQKEKGAAKSFEWAYNAEKVHVELFRKAKETVDKGSDVQLKAIQICEVCGYTVEGDAPKRCPICKAKKEKFKSFT